MAWHSKPPSESTSSLSCSVIDVGSPGRIYKCWAFHLSAEKLIKVLPHGEKKKVVSSSLSENLRLLALEHNLEHTERSLQQFNHLEKTWTHKTGGQRKQSDGIEDQNHDIKNYVCVYIAMVTNTCIRGLRINIPLLLQKQESRFTVHYFYTCTCPDRHFWKLHSRQQRLIHKEHVAATDKTPRAEMLQ